MLFLKKNPYVYYTLLVDTNLLLLHCTPWCSEPLCKSKVCNEMSNGNIHKKGFCPEPPEDCDLSKERILLHCCCAPCSTAIIEWMVGEGLRPGIFFSNSNIVPFREYTIRRDELVRYAAAHGLETIDDEYDHAAWLAFVRRLESSPAAGQTLPVAKQTSPAGGRAFSSVERAFPVAECSSSVAERPSLVAEPSSPIAECSSPVAERASSVTERPSPATEHYSPVAEPVEATSSLVRQASPIIESHGSLIEKPLRQAQGPEAEPLGSETAPRGQVIRIADMPERGPRCLECFKFRLLQAARYAATHGYTLQTTTLASSRWKDLGQVDVAGRWACETVNSSLLMSGGDLLSAPCPDVVFDNIQAAKFLEKSGEDVRCRCGHTADPIASDSRSSTQVQMSHVRWWNQNWRRGGLQERRNALIKEWDMYNQTFCGCEFSQRH